MKTIQVIRQVPQASVMLATVVLISSCEGILSDIGRDAAERNVVTSLTPATTATFVYEDFHACPGLFGLGRDDDPPADLFIGLGTAAVGDSGAYRSNGHHLKRMRAHMRFNIDTLEIPDASSDSVLALLVFRATETDRSRERSSTERMICPSVVGRAATAESTWWRASSFRLSALDSDSGAIIPDRCILTTAGEYSCDVTSTVRGWLLDPFANPNLGLIAFGSEIAHNSCEGAEFAVGRLSLPGEHLECAAELANIRLEIIYPRP